MGGVRGVYLREGIYVQWEQGTQKAPAGSFMTCCGASTQDRLKGGEGWYVMNKRLTSHTGFGIKLMAKRRELLLHGWSLHLFSKH